MVNARILWLDSCQSTNDEAAERLDDLTLDAVASAHQTEGRGRAGRTWYSPVNSGLYLSVIGRPQFSQRHGGWVPLLTAVSVAEVLQEKGVSVTLKWPNDVIVDGKKLAGILCEARGNPSEWTVVIGIGLNIFKPSGGYPADVPAIALDECTAGTFDIRSLAEVIVSRVKQRLTGFSGEGWTALSEAWLAHAYPLGTRLTRGETTGEFAGLESDGALRLRTDAGIEIVHAGDVLLAGRLEA